ncbi:hypothetical protein N7493_007260 [Penicillium malachiteum]|uniref:Ribosomal protein eL8/eL30/eS12/Gadd45 domain-containing protein n=1 Tax=Penicillium malachiteum TaxID=1324776 RepID=A0AAD6MUN0_9EURO|nr:hypothetical protein N7493_007260 [Penicillium malachiteum]
MDLTSAAWPMADECLTQELLDVLQQSMKALNRGLSELIIIAGDTSPIAIVMPLPLICEDKNVPYVFVPSKIALGRACGLNRAIIAASINTSEASDLNDRIQQLKRKVDGIAI